MQTFGAFLVSFLATAGTLVAAAPTSGTPAKRASVPALHNGAYHGSGTLALAKTYMKFGKAMPDHLVNAVANITAANKAKRSTGSVTASSNQGDIQYLCPVQLGTPAQTLVLDFDTGSSDLWVFSSETASSGVNGQTTYKPKKSTTAKLLSGQSWSITYGDGSSSSGDVYSDVVSVGGLSVKGQAVESAKQVSSSFSQDSANDGLLGLAFSSINTVTPTQQKTFFDTAAGSLDAPLFTADLKHNADGLYNFGYIDDAAYTGSIFYAPVDNSQGFWTFTSSGYAIGSSSIGSTSLTGIADTGTTLLLIDDAVVSDYYSQVEGASFSSSDGGYTFDCAATLPDFTFAVGDGQITIPGDYINFGQATNGCFGGIQSDSGIGFSIFGDVALKAAFVVFDAGNLQVGWAAKNL